jgi:hypothetical protein
VPVFVGLSVDVRKSWPSWWSRELPRFYRFSVGIHSARAHQCPTWTSSGHVNSTWAITSPSLNPSLKDELTSEMSWLQPKRVDLKEFAGEPLEASRSAQTSADESSSSSGVI